MINYFKNNSLVNIKNKNKIVPVSQTNNLMSNSNILSSLNSFQKHDDFKYQKANSSFENVVSSALISAEHVNNLASDFLKADAFSDNSTETKSADFYKEKSSILSAKSHTSENSLQQKNMQNTISKKADKRVDYNELYQFILNEIKKEMTN